MKSYTMPDGWAVLLCPKTRWYHLDTKKIYNRKKFMEMTGATVKDINAMLYDKERKFPVYNKTVFHPEWQREIRSEHSCYLNTYEKPALTAVEGDISPFLEHCKYLFPDKERREILLNWIAFTIQGKGAKIKWCPVLQGEKGVGKSLFGRILTQCMGESNVLRQDGDELSKEKRLIGYRYGAVGSEYKNGAYTDKLLVIADDFTGKGEKEITRHAIDSTLTDRNFLRCGEKSNYGSEQNKFGNIFIITEGRKNLKLDVYEWRYTCLFSDAKAKGGQYLQQLNNWIDKNMSHLYYYFLQKDTPQFHGKDRFSSIDTKETKKVKIESMSPMDAFFSTIMRSKIWQEVGVVPVDKNLLCYFLTLYPKQKGNFSYYDFVYFFNTRYEYRLRCFKVGELFVLDVTPDKEYKNAKGRKLTQKMMCKKYGDEEKRKNNNGDMIIDYMKSKGYEYNPYVLCG